LTRAFSWSVGLCGAATTIAAWSCDCAKPGVAAVVTKSVATSDCVIAPVQRLMCMKSLLTRGGYLWRVSIRPNITNVPDCAFEFGRHC
jgi:hypothetical protein